jgi:hypothetical protein
MSRLAQAQEEEVVTAEMTAASALAEDGGRLQEGSRPTAYTSEGESR